MRRVQAVEGSVVVLQGSVLRFLRAVGVCAVIPGF